MTFAVQELTQGRILEDQPVRLGAFDR